SALQILLSWWWIAPALLLLVVLGVALLLVHRRGVPKSAGKPQTIQPSSGVGFDLGDASDRVVAAAQGRALDIVRELRWRAGQQLVDYLGGSVAPDALRQLIEEMRDPG